MPTLVDLIAHERFARAREALAGGADPHEADADGTTPLLAACEHGAPRTLVAALLAAGAEPDARDRTGWRPLDQAVAADAAPAVVATLLRAGARADGVDAEGCTALHRLGWTARPVPPPHRPALVPLLLRAGADVDARDDGGRTPLLAAVLRGAGTGAVAALVAAGADPDAPDAEGRTARGLAAGSGDRRLRRWLGGGVGGPRGGDGGRVTGPARAPQNQYSRYVDGSGASSAGRTASTKPRRR